MKDLEIHIDNKPGALAEMGEILAKAGISIEGGGAWVVDDKGIAHFLFEDAAAARNALEEKKISVVGENEVVFRNYDRINQDN